MPDMPPPIGRYPGNMPPPASASRAKSDAVVEPDTSYCCAVDRWGNAMSAPPSDGSWRSPVIPGFGIVPSGRGTQSRPDPRHPSGVAPGKRPRLTPNPAIAVRDDEPELREDLNIALGREQPRIDAVLVEYGVPLLPLRRTTAGQE